jgi:hypothetical protein
MEDPVMRSNPSSRIAALIAFSFFGAAASGQTVTLQEQLAAQYKLVKMSGNGTAVHEPGTLLSVQKGGIRSLPWRAISTCPAKFENNALHPPTGFCAKMMMRDEFRTGSKVYPLKIEINLEKAKIGFRVVSCDQCNGVDPPTGLKGEVIFQFAKGYLEKASAGEVEDAIGQVFAIASDDQQGQSGQQQSQNGQQPNLGGQGGQDPPGGQDPQQNEPQTVQLGMSTDQVESVLGRPDKIFNLGVKQIYLYKDVKVTFMNGKVSDVQ